LWIIAGDEASNCSLDEPTAQSLSETNSPPEVEVTANNDPNFLAFLNPEIYETDESDIGDDEMNFDEDNESDGNTDFRWAFCLLFMRVL
jgi:hypothetical protein